MERLDEWVKDKPIKKSYSQERKRKREEKEREGGKEWGKRM